METDGNIIEGVNIQVKAGLYVDQQTADICMNLLGIYFKNQGYAGALIRIDNNVPHPYVEVIKKRDDAAYLSACLSLRQND